jgi:hypothetical protein
VAFRDVEYAGRGRIRVLRTLYVDELGEDSPEFVTEVKAVVGRLAEVLGLVIESESKLRVELDRKVQQLADLQRRMAAVVERAGAARPHRRRKRVKVRAGARRTSSLGGTPVRAKAGPRREDVIDVPTWPRLRTPRGPSLSQSLESVFRSSQKVNVTAGVKREDGL